jgi:hypothetical protein
VVKNGGEGVYLREPGSWYQPVGQATSSRIYVDYLEADVVVFTTKKKPELGLICKQ